MAPLSELADYESNIQLARGRPFVLAITAEKSQYFHILMRLTRGRSGPPGRN